MKKRILAAFLASAAVLSFAGCSSSSTTSSSSADSTSSAAADTDSSAVDTDSSAADTDSSAADTDTDGDSASTPLTILAWESNSDIKAMVSLFCQETGYVEGTDIVVTTQGSNGEGARDQYSQYLSGDGDADLMCLEADWILQYINDDTLTAPLSDIGITEDQYSDAYAYTVAIGTNEAGVLKGASFQAAPGGFLYNAALAEQYLGVTSPEEMQELVKDWDTFQETAAKVYEASGGATSLCATEGGLWQVYQANRTQAWVVDGALQMDTSEEFYDIAKSFADNGYLASGVSQWDSSWYAAMKDGTAMGEFASTWGLTSSTGSMLSNFTAGADGGDSSAESAMFALCQGPTGYFWGGTWLAVSTKCDNKELAKEFVEFFTVNADTMQKYSEATGDFCNSKTVMKSMVDAGTNSNALLVDGQDQFQILYDQADAIDMDGKITKYDSVIKSHFNTSVQGYIDGTYATKDDAVAAFKTNVKASFPELTVE